MQQNAALGSIYISMRHQSFTDADFLPLDDFSLLWRWTRHGAEQIATHRFPHLRAFAGARAATLHTEAVALAQQRAVGELELNIIVEADEPENVQAVRQRLLGLIDTPEMTVVVSWDAQTAALTTWQYFAQYWDDFCYPSSDDVTVWAPGERWVLNYRHFQALEFCRDADAT